MTEYKGAVSLTNKVSLGQVNQYINRTRPETKSGVTYTVEPYVVGADTLMYIINYGDGDGWQILSADKRTPAVLAEGETGVFFLDRDNVGLIAWVDHMSTDIANVLSSTDDELTFSSDDILINLSAWEGNSPKGEITPIFGDDEGHWEVTTTSETQIVESREHMTPHWDQNEPYNEFCPLKTDASGNRAPAGCVALAGSEVLYYLHSRFGEPETMVSSGICTGYVGNYSRYFYNNTSVVWAQMDSTYTSSSSSSLPEAIMIGFIGQLINMNYSNEYSWALPSKLKTDVFEPFGYNCTSGGYDESVVRANLSEELPIIVTASNMLIPIDFNIHCFVIDGYRKTRIKYTNYYHWVPGGSPLLPPTPGNGGVASPNEHPGGQIGGYADYTTITYSNPVISSIKINWGWASQWTDHLNDGWYSLTAGWVVTNGQTFDYNYNFATLYGFNPANN